MKLRLLLPTLLLSLFPLAGAAQLPSLAPVPRSETPLVDQLLAFDGRALGGGADATPVLPIWSGSDGQLLAVLALPRDWVGSPAATTPGYAGPSGWHLAGSTGSGAALRWQFGSGFRADAAFGQYGFGNSQPCTGEACAAWAPTSITGMLGLGWTSPGAGLDLSYGLSWLDTPQAATPASSWQPAAGNAWLPTLAIPGADGYSVGSETAVYARGSWHIDQGTALGIGASFGRSRLVAPGPFNVVAPGLDLDQLSLSLGLAAGSLRGAVVGHVTRSDDPALAGKRWTALDLGISWRTPWSGELSLGAQNLWSAPGKTPREADTQGRTPYIQYRQDL